MAYYLKKPNDTAYVSFPNVVLPTSTDFELHLDFGEIVLNQSWRPIGNAGTFANRVFKFASSNDIFITSSTSNPTRTIPAGTNYSARNLYVFKRISNNIRLEINGVDQGVTWSDPQTYTFNAFFRQSASTAGDRSALYRAKIFNASGDLIHDWDPSASNGTGTTLIDTVGGNNGTLVNFPTDNSQWVFYDDGGATTAATAFTMPQFSVSASASNSVPVFTAESAFTMPQFSIAAQAGIDAGQITASASFTMPQFSASATASNSVPVFSGFASFTMPQFTVAAQASSIASGVGASVSFAMPQLTVAANAESTLPDYIAIAAFTMPQFTVQVVSGDAFPSVANRVLFKMPQFTVDCETINDLFEQPGTYSQPTSNPSIYQV